MAISGFSSTNAGGLRRRLNDISLIAMSSSRLGMRQRSWLQFGRRCAQHHEGALFIRRSGNKEGALPSNCSMKQVSRMRVSAIFFLASLSSKAEGGARSRFGTMNLPARSFRRRPTQVRSNVSPLGLRSELAVPRGLTAPAVFVSPSG